MTNSEIVAMLHDIVIGSKGNPVVEQVAANAIKSLEGQIHEGAKNYVVVPREPTIDMLNAGSDAVTWHVGDYGDYNENLDLDEVEKIYIAMIESLYK